MLIPEMALNIVVGVQAGDEGKGLHVYRMAEMHDIVARFNGGANAGHTNMYNGEKVATHQIPSGIFYDGVFNVIGNGSLYDPVALFEKEKPDLEKHGLLVTPGRLAVSDTAHLVLPHHIFMDAIAEAGNGRQGSTVRGIRYVAADKNARIGVRGEDIIEDPNGIYAKATKGWEEAEWRLRRAKEYILSSKDGQETWDELAARNFEEEFERWHAAAQQTIPFLVDSVSFINDALDEGKNVLAEGAQSIGLDIEHGEYPLGTSSNAAPAGALSGLGVSHEHIDTIYGIAKIYKSRVGGQGFPTQFSEQEKDIEIRVRGKREDKWGEYGASTERPRDLGWFDLNDLRAARRLGVTSLILTKGDLAHLAGDTMKIADYHILDGEVITRTPSSAAKLARSIPHYVEMPTWEGAIQHVKTADQLPTAAQNFIDYVEDQSRIPVSAMGVGTEIDQFVTVH